MVWEEEGRVEVVVGFVKFSFLVSIDDVLILGR